MIEIEIDGHIWRGEHRAWSESVALLHDTADVVLGDDTAFMAAVRAFDADDTAGMVPMARRLLSRAPAVVLRWLDGYERDGEPVTDASLAGTGWEPAIAAALVARAHGFFTFSAGLRAAAMELVPDALAVAREASDRTPTTSDDLEDGPAASGDATG